MIVGDSLTRTTCLLADADIPLPQLEAEGIVRHVLSLDRAELFAVLDNEINSSLVAVVNELAVRRLAGEPLAYLTGRCEFYGLDLIVNENVLVPRGETELLVEEVLQYARRQSKANLTVADVGTGSGAIAVTIACSLPTVTVLASDISTDALAVADVNRRRHNTADRVHLLEGELLQPLNQRVDVIVSNPPYIPTARIEVLGPEVGHEPRVALDGGIEGLDVVMRLINEAPSYLKPGGRLIIEIDPDQLPPVTHAANEAFPGRRVSSSNDFLDMPRILIVDDDVRASKSEHYINR